MTVSPRLVAFDLDGTLIGRDLTISPRVQKAIARVRGAGVAGCLVTGRMYRASVPYARQLALHAPIVCYQGAAVIDPATGEILSHSALDNAVVLELIDIAASKGWHLQLYRNDEYYVERKDAYTDLYAQLSKAEPVVVPSLREAFAYSPSTKAVVVAEPAQAQAYAAELSQRLAGRAYVTRSLPEFVEILDPSVDKGDALALVARRLGVPMEAVMAIGDSWNDAPLLRAAGLAVAMGSAPAELRDLADAVVGDVASDGVAEALDRFVP